jgi:hypothetical protein
MIALFLLALVFAPFIVFAIWDMMEIHGATKKLIEKQRKDGLFDEPLPSLRKSLGPPRPDPKYAGSDWGSDGLEPLD